jgi:hypothetical protein
VAPAGTVPQAHNTSFAHGAAASLNEAAGTPKWNKRFTFRHSRPEDERLLEHFDLIPQGSRRKRLRSLLTMAFVIEQSPLAGSPAASQRISAPGTTVAALPEAGNDLQKATVDEEAREDAVVAVPPAPQEKSPSTPNNSSADMALLFGAMSGMTGS